VLVIRRPCSNILRQQIGQCEAGYSSEAGVLHVRGPRGQVLVREVEISLSRPGKART
jgi:hypothetical protein